MLRRYRPRKRFLFWLNYDIEADVRLMDYIDYLRKSRQFVTTVRNGLRLMWTLGDGDLSVLFELFPTLRAQLEPPAPPVIPPPDTSGLEQRIEQLQALILQNSAGNGLLMSSTPPALPAATGGMKTLAGFDNIKFEAPDDDDQPTIILKRDTSVNSGQNLLDAAFGLKTIPTEGAPDHVRH